MKLDRNANWGCHSFFSLFALFAWVASFAPSGAFAAQNPGAEFSLRLFRQVTKSNLTENLLISPYAVRMALGMASLGAKGRTQKQLGKAPEPWSQKKDPSYKLLLANRLWVQIGNPLLDDYMELSDKSFGVRPWMVNFEKAPDFVADRINGWVEEKTFGKVRNAVTEDILDTNMKMFLNSAAYFKGEWVSAFQRSETSDQTFYPASGKEVDLPFLHKTGNFLYSKINDVQVLEMPYLDGEIAMTILLPASNRSWHALEANLKPETIDPWVEGLALTEVAVSLPKVDLSSSVELTESLKSLGMSDPFDPEQADFSGMTGKKDLTLGRVFHKTILALTEEGTEVISNVSTMPPSRGLASVPSAPVAFRADHPFLFMIRHRGTNSILFIGRVAKVTKKD